MLASAVGLQSACSDDGGGPAAGSAGSVGASAGSPAGGAVAAAGNAGTSAGTSGAAGAEGGASGSSSAGSNAADAGEPAVGQSGDGGQGGAPLTGDAGSGGEGPLPCAGELIGSECITTPFARVQSATQTAGTAATMDTVKLGSATTAGNTLLLGVGVIWNGVAQTISVPAAYTLLERRDNTTGASSHESVALYLVENAASLPASTGATVSVADAQARLFLVLSEYAGLRSSGVLDKVASQAGNGAPSPGSTSETSNAAELWVVLTMSRGGGGHTDPTNGFAISDIKLTGAGSFSLMSKLAAAPGIATASLSGSGDYASVIATLRR